MVAPCVSMGGVQKKSISRPERPVRVPALRASTFICDHLSTGLRHVATIVMALRATGGANVLATRLTQTPSPPQELNPPAQMGARRLPHLRTAQRRITLSPWPSRIVPPMANRILYITGCLHLVRSRSLRRIKISKNTASPGRASTANQKFNPFLSSAVLRINSTPFACVR